MMKTKIPIIWFFNILSSALLLFLALFGCGVKSKPLPPDKPVFIGQGQKDQDPNLPEALNPELIEKHFKQNKDGAIKKPSATSSKGQ